MFEVEPIKMYVYNHWLATYYDFVGLLSECMCVLHRYTVQEWHSNCNESLQLGMEQKWFQPQISSQSKWQSNRLCSYMEFRYKG